VNVDISVFRDATLNFPVDGHRRFKGLWCLYFTSLLPWRWRPRFLRNFCTRTYDV